MIWFFKEAFAEGNSLPTGTSLPGGAVLPMSSVADFPMVLPQGLPSSSVPCSQPHRYGPLGTKMPGGLMVPVRFLNISSPHQADRIQITMQKTSREERIRDIPGPICSIQ